MIVGDFERFMRNLGIFESGEYIGGPEYDTQIVVEAMNFGYEREFEIFDVVFCQKSNKIKICIGEIH